MTETEPIREDVDSPPPPPSPPLAAILAEVRAVEPAIDWERLEARLFDETGAVRSEFVEAKESPRPARTPRGVRVAIVASGLAIAAAFAVALISPKRTGVESASPSAAVTRSSPLLFDDARPAAIGERVVGGEAGTWLRAQGRVAIRVEPGAVVRVLDDGERVRLALDSGAVAADVVPVAGGEPYAVDVLGRRVAVHGTRLRVAIVPGTNEPAIEVAVSEGSGVVGAPTEGRTEGTSVPAGAIGTFAGTGPIGPNAVVVDPDRARSLVDGSLSGKPAPANDAATAPSSVTAQVETSAKPPPSKPPVAATAAAGGSSAELALAGPVEKPGLSAPQLQAPLAKIDAVLQACAPHEGAGVTASFTTTLTLHVDPDGRIADFKAELDPPMRECFRVHLAKVRFPAAEGSTVVTHPIVLGAR